MTETQELKYSYQVGHDYEKYLNNSRTWLTFHFPRSFLHGYIHWAVSIIYNQTISLN